MKKSISITLLFLTSAIVAQKTAMYTIGKGFLSGQCGNLNITGIIGGSPINGIFDCGDQYFFIGFPDDVDLFTTPTKEVTIKSNVVIYPNPGDQMISIKPDEGLSTLKVLNYSGILVQSFLTIPDQINISTWPPGLYLFIFRYKDGAQEIKKFIKN